MIETELETKILKLINSIYLKKYLKNINYT